MGHFGPVVDYFRGQGAEVVLLCDNRQTPKEHGYKAYLYPYLKKVKGVFHDIEVIAYHSTKEFVDKSIIPELNRALDLNEWDRR